MITLESDWGNCERGNTWLMDDDGHHVAWFDLPGTSQMLEVVVNHENYPGFNLQVLSPEKSEPANIVAHIHARLGGWYAKKCNLDGVRIDEHGYVIGDDDLEDAGGEDAINDTVKPVTASSEDETGSSPLKDHQKPGAVSIQMPADLLAHSLRQIRKRGDAGTHFVVGQRPTAVDGNVSGDVVDESIDKAAAMDVKFVPSHNDMLAALHTVKTALADFRDGRPISVGSLEELKYNVVDPVLDGDEVTPEPQRYANIYVDLPNKDLIGSDHAPWDNVLSLENATKEEAVQWIRDNIGHCDDDGNICLLTLGDPLTAAAGRLQPRLMATLRLQTDVERGKYIVNTGETFEFDATEALLEMPLERIRCFQENSYDSDELSEGHPERERHGGPFEVDVDIDEWLAQFDYDRETLTQEQLDSLRARNAGDNDSDR